MRHSTRGILLAAALVGVAGAATYQGLTQRAKDQLPEVTVYKSPT